MEFFEFARAAVQDLTRTLRTAASAMPLGAISFEARLLEGDMRTQLTAFMDKTLSDLAREISVAHMKVLEVDTIHQVSTYRAPLTLSLDEKRFPEKTFAGQPFSGLDLVLHPTPPNISDFLIEVSADKAIGSAFSELGTQCFTDQTARSFTRFAFNPNGRACVGGFAFRIEADKCVYRLRFRLLHNGRNIAEMFSPSFRLYCARSRTNCKPATLRDSDPLLNVSGIGNIINQQLKHASVNCVGDLVRLKSDPAALTRVVQATGIPESRLTEIVTKACEAYVPGSQQQSTEEDSVSVTSNFERSSPSCQSRYSTVIPEELLAVFPVEPETFDIDPNDFFDDAYKL
eukprot:c23223_g1_i1.p1 GENE.c23223_g1_i1~~c23223_g1_i1.p1  ORF type:complete len:344 (+),score=66.73 c23223_g1_i1:27-1058(+)